MCAEKKKNIAPSFDTGFRRVSTGAVRIRCHIAVPKKIKLFLRLLWATTTAQRQPMGIYTISFFSMCALKKK